MASSQILKSSYHSRSISWPSTAHPIAAQFSEQLYRLRSSQDASTILSSSLSDRLSNLTELYACVDELLQLPSNQQSLSQIQAMLDGSLRVIDICSTTRDVLIQSKERVLEIQSMLRRRCSDELHNTSEVAEYLNARKVFKKVVKKCLKNIKECSKTDETNESEYFLGDVEQITLDIFNSLLSYIGGTKFHPRKTWSVVAKLIQKGSGKEEAYTTVFSAADSTLESLVCPKKKTGLNIENVRNQMAKLEFEIEELNEVLECLFRRLVKTRANLLNILSS